VVGPQRTGAGASAWTSKGAERGDTLYQPTGKCGPLRTARSEREDRFRGWSCFVGRSGILRGGVDIRYRSCSRRCTWKAEPHTSAISIDAVEGVPRDGDRAAGRLDASECLAVCSRLGDVLGDPRRVDHEAAQLRLVARRRKQPVPVGAVDLHVARNKLRRGPRTCARCSMRCSGDRTPRARWWSRGQRMHCWLDPHALGRRRSARHPGPEPRTGFLLGRGGHPYFGAPALDAEQKRHSTGLLPRPRRQPPDQHRHPPRRDHPRALPSRDQRLPPTQTRRRQDEPRSAPLPQTPPRPPQLAPPPAAPARPLNINLLT
jgi:hypothetical protein